MAIKKGVGKFFFFVNRSEGIVIYRLFYRSFIINSVISIDSSGYQNENLPSCMRYVGARFIQVYGRELPLLSHSFCRLS